MKGGTHGKNSGGRSVPKGVVRPSTSVGHPDDDDDLRRARRRAQSRTPTSRFISRVPELVLFSAQYDGSYYIDGMRFCHHRGRHRRLRSPSDSETDTSER